MQNEVSLGSNNPLRGMARGARCFPRGLSWLRAHPPYLFWLFLPMLAGVLVLMASWGLFFHYSDNFFTWALFAKPASWWGLALYHFVKALLWGVMLLLGLVFCALFVNVLSSPLYDYVSMAVERDLIGEAVSEPGFWDSVKLIGEELKKFLFILTITVGLLLIPGVNILAPVMTAFFVGWDLYDLPLARRGWAFRQRVRFVLRHAGSVLGLGLWLLVPGLQILFLPLAVVGGTIIAVEDLQRDSLLKRKDRVHVT